MIIVNKVLTELDNVPLPNWGNYIVRTANIYSRMTTTVHGNIWLLWGEKAVGFKKLCSNCGSTVPVNNFLLACRTIERKKRKSKLYFLAFLTLFPSQAAIAHWLKYQVYRQLVPLNFWTKPWHFWGHTKGVF